MRYKQELFLNQYFRDKTIMSNCFSEYVYISAGEGVVFNHQLALVLAVRLIPSWSSLCFWLGHLLNSSLCRWR